MLIRRILKGNSIRFEIEYKTVDDIPAVPGTPTFKVYDNLGNEIHSEAVDINNFLLDEFDDPIIGGYYLNYVFADSGDFTVEFNGVFDTKLTVVRQKIKVVFV